MKINTELKTPYYVIDEEYLNENFNKLENALKKYWNHYVIGYSYKTNSLPWIVNYFDQKGCYSEVVSADEYELGKQLGIQENRFIYNGPIKTKETFLEAISNGSIVNIDSNRELEWLKELPKNLTGQIGIRINFDVEKYCPGESQCGDEGGRFGFCYENGAFEEAIKCLRKNGIKLSGIHLHTSSKTRSLCIYEAIAQIAVEVIQKYQLELDYIDIGGGFFGGLANKPQFDDYIRLISEILSTAVSIEKTKLIIEPGMCLIGAPIQYVSTVIDVKDTTYNRFVVTDGTRTSIDPLMTKTSYFHSYERTDEDRATIKKQIICGYTCMEHDRLFMEEDAKELKVGDVIVYDKVGAYTMCLTPLFIQYFPDVYVQKNGQYIKVRDKWTAQQYIQNCMPGGQV